MNELKFTDEDLHIIHAGLMELQAKYAIPIIDKINAQLRSADDLRHAKAIPYGQDS